MPIDQPNKMWSGRFREPLNRAKLFQHALLALALTGCREKPDIHWSTQAYSPDKHWLAIATGEAGGSFGGGYESTTVSLKQAEQSPVEILEVDHLFEKAALHLNWKGPQHLEVTTESEINPNDVHFQAIKCGDVTISIGPSLNKDEPAP